MTYRAPINDMLLALNHGAGLQAAVTAGHYGDFDSELTAPVLEEAGRFATDVLAPLNRIGDENGIKLDNDKVTTAPGWHERLSALDRRRVECGVGTGSLRWARPAAGNQRGVHRDLERLEYRLRPLPAADAERHRSP